MDLAWGLAGGTGRSRVLTLAALLQNTFLPHARTGRWMPSLKVLHASSQYGAITQPRYLDDNIRHLKLHAFN